MDLTQLKTESPLITGFAESRIGGRAEIKIHSVGLTLLLDFSLQFVTVWEEVPEEKLLRQLQ